MALRGRLGRFEKRLAEIERARAEEARANEIPWWRAAMTGVLGNPRGLELLDAFLHTFQDKPNVPWHPPYRVLRGAALRAAIQEGKECLDLGTRRIRERSQWLLPGSGDATVPMTDEEVDEWVGALYKRADPGSPAWTETHGEAATGGSAGAVAPHSGHGLAAAMPARS